MPADRVSRGIGLRLRIVAVAVVGVGLAVTVGAVLLVGVLRSRLDSAATTAASLRARDVATLASAATLPRQLALPGEEAAFVQVVDNSGLVVASTQNIEGEPPVIAQQPQEAHVVTTTVRVGPLDQTMRVVAVTATTATGTMVVYAGESLASAHDTTSAVVELLAFGVPVLLLIVGAVVWWSVGRTLRPVRAITRTMTEITASDLHRRVPTPSTRDEIGVLASTVNETLARLDNSVEQQRRFVADASHELRGPLASLRADLEISVTHPELTLWTDVARNTLSDVERLQELTDDLLLLARLDSQAQRTTKPVDLAEITTTGLHTMRRHDVDVTTDISGPPAMIDGDPDQLHRLVRNLIHNAEEHAATRIEIAVQTGVDVVRLIVADDGPGIPVEFRDSAFERFVRLDTARTRDSGGTGLGLAIVRDVATAHHGTISISDSDPHGTTIIVTLPRQA